MRFLLCGRGAVAAVVGFFFLSLSSVNDWRTEAEQRAGAAARAGGEARGGAGAGLEESRLLEKWASVPGCSCSDSGLSWWDHGCSLSLYFSPPISLHVSSMSLYLLSTDEELRKKVSSTLFFLKTSLWVSMKFYKNRFCFTALVAQKAKHENTLLFFHISNAQVFKHLWLASVWSVKWTCLFLSHLPGHLWQHINTTHFCLPTVGLSFTQPFIFFLIMAEDKVRRGAVSWMWALREGCSYLFYYDKWRHNRESGENPWVDGPKAVAAWEMFTPASGNSSSLRD